MGVTRNGDTLEKIPERIDITNNVQYMTFFLDFYRNHILAHTTTRCLYNK